ncbi:hypothetical protein HNY73_007590 [Argiope bruennichi]|uniref:Uncharacterized protein n=1 Tax=Argiope bruennichi TaxID=94029 RepID=A0A8T0FF20_ARGBR|nr:hypothetical protein HNY73_007590 [Argiope bruennichi]
MRQEGGGGRCRNGDGQPTRSRGGGMAGKKRTGLDGRRAMARADKVKRKGAWRSWNVRKKVDEAAVGQLGSKRRRREKPRGRQWENEEAFIHMSMHKRRSELLDLGKKISAPRIDSGRAEI